MQIRRWRRRKGNWQRGSNSGAEIDVPCGAVGVGVGLRAEFNGTRVAAAGSQGEGNAGSACSVEHLTVALNEALRGEGEVAEGIGVESIDTGLVEDDVRLEGEDLRQGGFELK